MKIVDFSFSDFFSFLFFSDVTLVYFVTHDSWCGFFAAKPYHLVPVDLAISFWVWSRQGESQTLRYGWILHPHFSSPILALPQGSGTSTGCPRRWWCRCPWRCSWNVEMWHLGMWFSGHVVMGWWLDLMILVIFSNLNDSMKGKKNTGWLGSPFKPGTSGLN